MLKIAREVTQHCPRIAESVNIEDARHVCALKHGCDEGRHCELYVERLIHQVVKEHGFLK